MSSTVVHASFLPSSPSPVYSTGYPRRRRQVPPPLGLQKVQESALAAEAALQTGGLQTPPADDNMSMAYSSAMLSNTYDSHVALARQPPNALAQPSRNAVILCDALHQFPRVEQQPQLHAQYPQQIYLPPTLGGQPSSTSSRHSTRPSTPSSTCTIAAHSEGTVSRRDSTMVTHNLQLPSCISPDGGNLDEFAATMTCFFWFETMDTIQAAERLGDRRSLEPIPPLSSHSEPCSAYLKWVNTILSTTQVTQNVILLALLFVYRLKKSNPKVNGNPGSEYRLLTVALMLSNKFLDDNTYTNKTWAEVSCIPVKEIHVMEVEFLSNMRYGLLTSKEQWQEWLQKLTCYREYYERAKMEKKHCQAPPLSTHVPVHVPSPTHKRFASPLPSPTNTVLPSSMQGPTAPVMAYSSNSALNTMPQNWHPSYQPSPTVPATTVSPHGARPSQGVARKRSLEGGEQMEPAPKRIPRQPPHAVVPSNRPTPTTGGDLTRLPIPHLTLDTSQAIQSLGHPPQSTYPPQPTLSLPPLGPGMRAMSTVYPAVTTTWTPQGAIMATCGPQTPSFTAPSNYTTPSRRQSPNSLAAFASSPLGEPFGTHTPTSNSPSVYLQQRASPYKPVRRVNTLLYPPPSMPLSEYHMGSSQMHYQPIGRRNDVRSGIVPEFVGGYASSRPANQGPPNHIY
ncbi:hypothetical protein DL765_010229 [Monosporascus sp. GIB2]|nr:hypothetical protein DL765_010229 [Monosporascus sp. GIB2]